MATFVSLAEVKRKSLTVLIFALGPRSRRWLCDFPLWGVSQGQSNSLRRQPNEVQQPFFLILTSGLFLGTFLCATNFP